MRSRERTEKIRGMLNRVAALLEARGSRKPAACRDLAIVLVARDLDMKIRQLSHMDLADVDAYKSTITSEANGTLCRHTLPAPTMAAIAAWLEHRGLTAGPLWQNLDRAHQNVDRRLSGKSIYLLIARYAREGVRYMPPTDQQHATESAVIQFWGE